MRYFMVINRINGNDYIDEDRMAMIKYYDDKISVQSSKKFVFFCVADS